MSERRPCEEVYSVGAAETTSDTRDFAVSLVSLLKRSAMRDSRRDNDHVLDDIKRGEQDELRLVILANPFDMRLECFDDMFAVLWYA